MDRLEVQSLIECLPRRLSGLREINDTLTYRANGKKEQSYERADCKERRDQWASLRAEAAAPDLVLAGAAPYILYVDDAFYCTSESRNAADDEIKALQ